MIRVLGAIVWVCLILIVLAQPVQSAEENEAVPVIELEMATYDFGQVSQGEVVRQDFRVLNRGSVPLEINSVIPSCGCSTARFDRTIPPGGDGKIVLEVRTNGYQGDIHKTARVFTNDPKHPQVIIGMKGRVWVPIHINPRYVHLKGVLGDKIERGVHLTAEKQEPLVIKVASVSIPDKVAVELQEIEKGRRYELRVKNKVEKETAYQGHVRLTTNYAEKPEVVIRISGRITGAP